MASNTINTRIQLKNDTEANWMSSVHIADGGTKPNDQGTNFIPRKGEVIIYAADDTHPFPRLKVGDEVTNVVNLPFLHAESSNGILDYDFTKFPNGLNYKGIIRNKDTNTYTLIGENESVDAKHGDLVQDSNEDYYAFDTTQPATAPWLKLIPIDLEQSEKLITERTLYYYKGNSNISKLGTITQGTWNANTIDVSNGGTGRTTFTAGALLYGNGSDALNSGIMSWDQSWSWANNDTSNGPTINLNIGNDLNYALPAIPIATPTHSGVITTGAQNLMGVKTLVNGELRIKCNGDNIRQNNKIIFGTIASDNSNNNNTIFTIDKNEWASINVKTPYDRSNNSDLTETGKIQFSFKQYGTAIDVNNDTYDSTSYYEEYVLPESTISSTENTNKIYNILTTKNTITVEQGGTGQTSFAANAILYGNGSGAIQSIAPAWQAWVTGTAEGPQAKIQIGNIDYTSSAIPSASTSASGIVTTSTQSFAGDKTFTDQVILSKTTDASGSASSESALIIGTKTGYHLAFDTNKIMAKSNDTTTSTLNLNPDGGNVIIGINDANYNTQILSTVNSSSKTTGALVVGGGAGFGGTVYANAFNGPLTGNISGYSGAGTRIRSALVKGTNPSETYWQSLWYNWQNGSGTAQSDRVAGAIESYVNASGVSAICLMAYQFASGSTTHNSMEIRIAKDGTYSYALSSPSAFKAALSLGTAAMDVRVGSYDGVTQHWGIGAIVQATSKGTKAYLGKRTSLVTTDTGCFLYNNTDSATIWSCVPDDYVLKSGSTMTGTLTLKASTYYAAGGGINANNADIIGVNGIFTADAATSFGEGINFYRSATTWDSLVAKEGTFYFGSNKASSALLGDATIRSGSLYSRGDLNIISTAADGTSATNGITETAYKSFTVRDKNEVWAVTYRGKFYTDGRIGGNIAVRNYINSAWSEKTMLEMTVANNGTIVYTVADKAAFRTAIGAGTSSLTIGTSSTTAMAGNTNVTQVRQGASTSSKWRKILLGATEYAAYNTDVGDTIDGNALMAKSVAVQPSTGKIQAAGFVGPLTGNVTGNCSGTAGAVAWGDVTGKPSTFAPTIGTTATTAAAGNHTHSYLPLSGGTLYGNLYICPNTTTTLGSSVSLIGGKINNASTSDDNYNYNSYAGNWTRIYLQNRYKATKKSDNSVTWNSSRIYFRQWSATANSGTHLDYYETYYLPTCTDGKTANSSYSILTTKAAVTVGQGGTGATTAAGAKTNLGFRHGILTASDGGGIVVNHGTIVSKTVSWSATPTVPTVVVGFVTDSDAASFGNCCCSVVPDSITTTGCTIKIFNGDTYNRRPKIAWIAIG